MQSRELLVALLRRCANPRSKVTHPHCCPTSSPQDRTHLGPGIEQNSSNNPTYVATVKWQTSERNTPTCYDALHGYVAALAEPERDVFLLVQPLPVPLVQQRQVLQFEVVGVKINRRKVL